MGTGMGMRMAMEMRTRCGRVGRARGHPDGSRLGCGRALVAGDGDEVVGCGRGGGHLGAAALAFDASARIGHPGASSSLFGKIDFF